MAANPKLTVKGAKTWQYGLLGGLFLLLIWVIYSNSSSQPGSSDSAPAPARSTATPAPAPAVSRAPNIRRDTMPVPGTRGARGMRVFHPTLKQDKDNPVDYTKIDPTLRLDLLAKLQTVTVEGSGRSLFDFGVAPVVAELAKAVGPIKPGAKADAGSPKPGDPGAKPVEPSKPPPAPIPLKFYGFVNPATGNGTAPGPKRAFFLDGDDIFVAAEGDTIKNRYKVIRIGVNSAVVEDTSAKNEQTLKLMDEAAG